MALNFPSMIPMNPANRAAAITLAARRPSPQPTLARQELAQTVAAASKAASAPSKVTAAATAAGGTGASSSNALFPAAAAAKTVASCAPGSSALFPMAATPKTAGNSAPGSNALFPNATAAPSVTAPTVAPPAPAQPPTAQSAFGANPWLAAPTGTGPTGTYTYNPFYFATPQSAAAVAAMVGGTVVAVKSLGGPSGNPYVQDQPNQMVRLANGAMINPGLVASFYTHGYPQSMVDQMVANEVANVSKGV